MAILTTTFQFGISGLLEYFLILKCHRSGIFTIQNHCIKAKSPSKSIGEGYWKKVFIPFTVKCIYYLLIFDDVVLLFFSKTDFILARQNAIILQFYLLTLAARLLFEEQLIYKNKTKTAQVSEWQIEIRMCDSSCQSTLMFHSCFYPNYKGKLLHLL